MELTFGGRLRQQRERQQISLNAIAADTKIKVSLLEGLERDDLAHWPERIYRRAYVRSYARAIGLDPETVVREFLELYPDPVEADPGEAAAADAASAAALQSGTIFRRLVSSAIGAVPAFLQRTDRQDAPAPGPVPEQRSSQSRSPLLDASTRSQAADAGNSRTPTHPADRFQSRNDRSERLRQDGAHDHRAARGDGEPIGSSVAEAPQRSVAATVPEAAGSGADIAAAGLSGDVPAETIAERIPSRYGTDSPEVNLPALAALCTRLGRVLDRRELVPLLDEAGRLLDAVGLIVWLWDGDANVLRASLARGYPDAALAQWPGVALDAENGIAAAFRSASPCVVDGGGTMTGAVVVPLLGPRECAGVLAVELRHGGERRDAVQAAATILAAQLVTLVGPVPVAAAVNT